MPHIPEDELHAYLDQALSRSQCVEIESHLAACPRCQSLRDGIAALRDRTTALLSVLAPPVTLPPGIETIRARALGVHHGRQRAMRAGIWAASLLAALGLGWTANRWLSGGEASGGNEVSLRGPDSAAAQLPSVPDSSRASSPSPAPIVPAANPPAATVARLDRRQPAPAPASAQSQPVTRDAVDTSLTPTTSVAVDPLPSMSDTMGFSASNSAVLTGDQGLGEMATETMWRIVSIGDAEQESGAPVASVPGLPVVQVKVQGVQPNQRIVAVDQQLASGQVIRTIEGPAAQMSDLLARDGQRSAAGTAASNAIEALMTMRFGDRMVAIRGPADSVRALMNRLPVPKKP